MQNHDDITVFLRHNLFLNSVLLVSSSKYPLLHTSTIHSSLVARVTLQGGEKKERKTFLRLRSRHQEISLMGIKAGSSLYYCTASLLFFFSFRWCCRPLSLRKNEFHLCESHHPFSSSCILRVCNMYLVPQVMYQVWTNSVSQKDVQIGSFWKLA